MTFFSLFFFIFYFHYLNFKKTLIVNPVREALDYYRKLNEASRRNLEQPASPTPAAATPVSSAHDIQEKESSPPAASADQQYSTTISNSIEDERKNSLQQMDHPIIVGAAPSTPISRERYYYNTKREGGGALFLQGEIFFNCITQPSSDVTTWLFFVLFPRQQCCRTLRDNREREELGRIPRRVSFFFFHVKSQSDIGKRKSFCV